MKDNIVQTVIGDLNSRSEMGMIKYGVTLEREDLDLKDWLQHAYEETLDKALYLKRAIKEIDKINNIEVVEPTELRKEFENDLREGDIVEFITNETFSPARKGDLCSVISVDDELVKLSYSGEKFWETKINVKKV